MSDKKKKLGNVGRRTALQIAGGGLVAGAFGTGVVSALPDDEAVEEFVEEFDGAAVRLSNQQTAGETVVVDELLLGDGGYISIHDVRRRFYDKGVDEDPIVESLIGISDHFEPGFYEDVTVELFGDHAPGVPAHDPDAGELGESQPLLALPHRRADDDDIEAERDGDAFVVADPAYREGPKQLRGFGPVNDIATVVVEGDSSYATSSAALETTEARFDFESDDE